MLNNYICALSLGSSKISAVVAELKKNRITDLFFESIPSRGFKNGAVRDSIAFIDSLGKVLKGLKAKSGINIKFIHANISGPDITTKHSRAIIPLAERGNKVITLSDIDKVIEQARILGSNLEEEIIHQIPFSYTIDSQGNIMSPVGLYSHSLEVDLFLVCIRLSCLQSLIRAINQAGYEAKKISLSGLATSNAVFGQGSAEKLNLLCDIGSDVTEILIFKSGLLKAIEILPLGGDDLSISLAQALDIPLELAEDVKKSYGVIREYIRVNEEKEILIKKNNIYKPIKQNVISQIITPKAKSMCETIKAALEKKITLSHADNFVITGGAALSEGFIEVLENTLGVSVKLARITDPDINAFLNREKLLSGHKYLEYITSLGMISGFLKGRQPQATSATPSKNPLIKAISRVKEVYQEYF